MSKVIIAHAYGALCRTQGSVTSWGQTLRPIIQAGFPGIRRTDFLANAISGYSFGFCPRYRGRARLNWLIPHEILSILQVAHNHRFDYGHAKDSILPLLRTHWTVTPVVGLSPTRNAHATQTNHKTMASASAITSSSAGTTVIPRTDGGLRWSMRARESDGLSETW